MTEEFVINGQNGTKTTVTRTTTVKPLPYSYYADTTGAYAPSILNAEATDNSLGYTNATLPYLEAMSKTLGTYTETTVKTEDINSCFAGAQSSQSCGCSDGYISSEDKKRLDEKWASFNDEMKKKLFDKTQTSENTGNENSAGSVGDANKTPDSKDTKAETDEVIDENDSDKDSGAGEVSDETDTSHTDKDKLMERIPDSGMLTSDPESDFHIEVKDDQWVSKVALALYGKADDKELNQALAELSGEENKDLIQIGDTLKCPRKIKLASGKEYSIPDDMSDEQAMQKAEENRVNIHAAKKTGNTSTKTHATQKKQNTPATPVVKKPVATPAVKKPTVVPVKKTGLNIYPTGSTTLLNPVWGEGIVKEIKGAYHEAKESLKDLKALLGVGRKIRTAGGDDAYVEQKVDKVAGNKKIMGKAIKTGSDVIAENPQIVAPAIHAAVPVTLDELKNPQNLEKFKPVMAELTPMGIDELKKPENIKKIQPVVASMINSPEIIDSIQKMINNTVKNSSQQITQDVLNGILNEAGNQTLLKQILEGMAGQIITEKDSPFIKGIADVAFNTLIQTVKNPEKFEVVQQLLDESLANRGSGLGGLAAGQLVRTPSQKYEAQRKIKNYNDK